MRSGLHAEERNNVYLTICNPKVYNSIQTIKVCAFSRDVYMKTIKLFAPSPLSRKYTNSIRVCTLFIVTPTITRSSK